MTHPSESQHWYTVEGDPCYTQIIKSGDNKGQERATTLADARKMNLKPSVTMIMNEAQKWGLEKWKQEQVLLAALTLPKVEGETEQEYVDRIIADSKEQGIKAAERGKQVHQWIQEGFEGTLPFYAPDGWDYYNAAKDELENQIGFHLWSCEMSFSTDTYGGKVDLHWPIRPGVVVDIKTKDKPLDDYTCKIWDEHLMQLAAYREGLYLPDARCGILFIGVQDIQAKLVWVPEEMLQRGMKMFNALLLYYYAKTGLGNV